MKNLRLLAVSNEELVLAVSALAEDIWHTHYDSILGEAQVDYMLEKFLSFDAIKAQIINGYEYFLIIEEYNFVGFMGIHEDENGLFLSKFYVHEEFRGKGMASETFKRLLDLCKLRKISKIWLTCNRNNTDSIAIYKHWGFKKVREEVTDIGGGYVMDDFIMEYEVK